MAKALTSSIRLASPIAHNISPFSIKLNQTPPRQSCNFRNHSKALKDSPKVIPRLCLAKTEAAKPNIPSRKLSFLSTDHSWLKSKIKEQSCIKTEDRLNFDSVINLDSPNREMLLNGGLDGLKVNPLVLGKGGFGVVLLALRKGRKVAAKIITKRPSRKNSCEMALMNEENGLKLQHPNLVEVLDIYGFRKEHALVIMELAGYRNLHQILENTNEIINCQRRIKFCMQIACAVSWCHRHRVAHLDIKPTNVIVNENDWCKLGDFGCSRILNQINAQRYFQDGTVAYRAPELLNYTNLASEKADIYSLAVTFWQILLRRIPFANLDTHTIIYKVVAQSARPEDDTLINKEEIEYANLYRYMWAQDPNQRPDINAVLKQLMHFIT